MNNNTAKTLGSTCFCNVLYRDTVKLSNLMRTISKRTENEEKNSPRPLLFLFYSIYLFGLTSPERLDCFRKQYHFYALAW